MAKKLAIRALQRGVGSMDYIDMLLIMEDPEDQPNDGDWGTNQGTSGTSGTGLSLPTPCTPSMSTSAPHTPAMSTSAPGTAAMSTSAQGAAAMSTSTQGAAVMTNQVPHTPAASSRHTSGASGSALFAPPPTASLVRNTEPVPEWCKCGHCRSMLQEIENRCCKSRDCVSRSRRFTKLCLDRDFLQLSIKSTCDIRNDRQDNSSRAFRKAAYRHYIIEEYGFLGKNKRKVCPSCCVWRIREHFPSATGVYMGFRTH